MTPSERVVAIRDGAIRFRVLSAGRGPAVFYLHPWEIDPDQPRLKAGRLSRFRHYRNLHDTEARLRRLLSDFRFNTMERLVADARVTIHHDERVALPLPYSW